MVAACNDGSIAFHVNLRTEATQLLHVHKAILKDGFHHDGAALRNGVQRHKLRLHIGGKSTGQGAQALICSEIGSEGRNFQFAHHLVLFDLPLEADLLEQRIGRLDRIGQRDTIELHVPYMRGAASEALTRWYRDGLASFESTCPAASAVFDRLGDELLVTLGDPGRVGALVQEAASLTARINTELEVGRDRLLELHSHQPGHAAELVEALRSSTGVTPLRDYMAGLLGCIRG